MTHQEPAKPASRFRPQHLIWAGIALIGLGTILFAVAVAVAFVIGKPVQVQGQAMMPALSNGDRVFMQKKLGQINRGDIVIFRYPLDASKSYIKRIIGLPGERVMIEGGKVFINGKLLEEPYISPEFLSQDALQAPVEIPGGHYFVLGDNRRNSSDSRYWGTLPRNLIYGKYWFRYWKNR